MTKLSSCTEAFIQNGKVRNIFSIRHYAATICRHNYVNKSVSFNMHTLMWLPPCP